MGGAPAAQSKQQSWPPDGALAGSPGIAPRENMPWLPHASGMNLSALDMPARTDPLPASKCSSMANSPTTHIRSGCRRERAGIGNPGMGRLYYRKRPPAEFDLFQFLATMISGTLFIVAAPSGAGKTTLVSRLIEHDPRVRHSISFTTRAPRPGELDGREYHFIDVQHFLAMRERGEFAEWAEVHGNFYGTSRLWLEQRMTEGCDMLLEIDWQGAQQMRRQFPEAVSIFILPPSIAELESRLRKRGADSEDVMARRIAGALGEMRHVGEFDFVIINKDLDVALGELQAAVRASRLRYPRQRARHPDVFRFLDQD